MTLAQRGPSLWSNRKYLFLISAQAVSNLGDWLYILALLVLIGVKWHASPALISLMMICNTLPLIVFGPMTGVLADKYNRTAVMMISNVCMAVLIGSIPLLSHRWEVFVVLFLAGAIESMFAPAQQAKLKEVVADEHMNTAVSTNSGISQMAKIVGPGLSGLLVGLFGAASAFYLDALSFILSTVLLLFTGMTGRDAASGDMTEPRAVTQHVAKEGVFARSTGGFKHIAQNRLFLIISMMTVLIMLVLQLTDSQFVTLLRMLPSLSPNLFGYVMAASGVGALVSAILVGKLNARFAIVTMCVGAILIGVGFGGEAIIVQFHWNSWLAIAGAFVAGLGAALVFIPYQSFAQRNTPNDLTGRVFGIIGSMNNGAALLGPVVGAALITAFGPISGFLTTGIGLVLIGIAAFLLQPWMKQRDRYGAEGDGSIQEATPPGNY